MRLLVTGAGGLLAHEFLHLGPGRGHRVIGLTRADVDVTDPDAIRAAVLHHRPDVVAHCAGYTAVDGAESEPDRAFLVNRDAVAYVAAAAAAVGALVVLPSTDYVFDGAERTPYLPDDPPRPLNVYGASKLAGEEALMAAGARHLIVRTSWLYGIGGRNFVRTILARARAREPLRVVADQRGRPTWAGHAAAAVLDLLDRGVEGVWHVADGGTATWHELAVETVRHAGADVTVEPISSEELGAPAPRPPYSVLDMARTEECLGRAMTPWRDALQEYLEEEA